MESVPPRRLTHSRGHGLEDGGAVEPPPRAGEYRTIVADPPWRYENTSTRNAAEKVYGTMTVAEMKRLPVAEWAAGEAHIYVWTTTNFLPRTFSLLTAWGFEYVSNLVWVKPQLGMGNYFRICHEHVLFGRRGSLRTRSRSVRSTFTADRTAHSAKPELFFDMVEEASEPPYLEMFARSRRLNPEWDYWGNEA